MPTSRHRLVFYCDELTADEVRRQAALDGRTVSSWLSRLVSDAVAADAGGDDHAPASRRERDDPEYAAWLRRQEGNR